MKKLTKEQLAEKGKFMGRLEEMRGRFEEMVTEYNVIVKDVEAWRDDVVTTMEDYASDRSDKWQESDAAATYDSWKSAYEDLDCSEIEEPEQTLYEELENLPDTPDAS